MEKLVIDITFNIVIDGFLKSGKCKLLQVGTLLLTCFTYKSVSNVQKDEKFVKEKCKEKVFPLAIPYIHYIKGSGFKETEIYLTQ